MQAIRCWRYSYLIIPSYGRICQWIETLKPIPTPVEWPAEQRALEDLAHGYTWEFGYLVESDYRMVEDWLFTIRRYGVSGRFPTEIRAAKDLTDGLKRLGD